MESGDTINNENIYYRCRKRAAESNEKLKSRESASELLGCSVSTLAKNELGVTKMIPPDFAVMTADLYNAPEIIAHYCMNECPIGRNLPIPTGEVDIKTAALNVLSALLPKNINEFVSTLTEVASGTEGNIKWVREFSDTLAKSLGELSHACKHMKGGNQW